MAAPNLNGSEPGPAMTIIQAFELPAWAVSVARTMARFCRPGAGAFTLRVVMPDRPGDRVIWTLAREDTLRQGGEDTPP